MSEPSPESGPPLSDDERRRLEEILQANMPDMAAEAIRTITGIHAQWYTGWQAAGIPEPRAAEFTAIMIRALFPTMQ